MQEAENKSGAQLVNQVPQALMSDQVKRVAAALAAPLPQGPQQWPGAVEEADETASPSVADPIEPSMQVAGQASPATPGEER